MVQKWKIVTWHYLKLHLVYSILLCSTGTADRKLPNSHNNIFNLWSGTGIHWPPVDLTTQIRSLHLTSWAKMAIFESFPVKNNRSLNPKKRDSNFFKKRDFARACVEGFILTDRLISQKIDESSGSTATAVLIDHDQVYCVSNIHYVIHSLRNNVFDILNNIFIKTNIRPPIKLHCN